jgi:hypothetical protein
VFPPFLKRKFFLVIAKHSKLFTNCHCERKPYCHCERSEAISCTKRITLRLTLRVGDCRVGLRPPRNDTVTTCGFFIAMTQLTILSLERKQFSTSCHCERSEAISCTKRITFRLPLRVGDCRVGLRPPRNDTVTTCGFIPRNDITAKLLFFTIEGKFLEFVHNLFIKL